MEILDIATLVPLERAPWVETACRSLAQLRRLFSALSRGITCP